MFKKRSLTVVLIALISLSVSFPSSAAVVSTPLTLVSQETIVPNAEQTEWVFRVLEDGTVQKRLWSLTYQEWLTDWITVPAA